MNEGRKFVTGKAFSGDIIWDLDADGPLRVDDDGAGFITMIEHKRRMAAARADWFLMGVLTGVACTAFAAVIVVILTVTH